MPFDKTTAAAAGRKGGPNRWRDKDPSTVRNRHVRLAVSQSELDMIDAKAVRENVSRTELVVRAVDKYEFE